MVVLSLLLLIIVIFEVKVERSNWLDGEKTNCIKGIFAYFVILHHLALLNIESSVVTRIYSHMGYFSTGVFFTISGYALGKKYNELNLYTTIRFWKRRIIKIVIPYFCVSLIYWGGYNLYLNENISIPEFLVSFFNGKPIISASWYIIVLLLYYIIYSLSWNLLCTFKFRFFFLSVGVIVSTFLFFYLGLGSNWYNSNFCFLLGVFLGKTETKYKKVYKNYIFITLNVFLLLISILLKKQNNDFNIIDLLFAEASSICLFAVDDALPTNTFISVDIVTEPSV